MVYMPKLPRLSMTAFTVLVSCALAILYNQRLWAEVFRLGFEPSVRGALFVASFAVLLIALFNLLLTLVAFRPLLKPAVMLVIATAALAAFFTDTYGVIVDRTMIQNMVETDAAEVRDLLTPGLFAHLFLFALLPAFLVYRTRIDYGTGLAGINLRVGAVLLSAAAIGAVALGFYQDYASLFRNHRHVTHLVVPLAHVDAAVKYAHKSRSAPRVVQPLGDDAHRAASPREKPALVVLVLGETARAKNFSLNGYARPTNARLGREDVLSFDHVQACGTSTAVSVPCMFSHLRRTEYDDATAKSRENLLDVLHHAGIEVLWRDNNSGCKGVCDRIAQQPAAEFRPAECRDSGCPDEVLLNGLEDYIDSRTGDTFIVLHQNGSHGPAYYRRYPKGFERFTPVCASHAIQTCTREAILNTYDNTIAYTDYFLSQVIALLKAQTERFDTAMLYVSDHGESLGEHNLYLHGLPYFIAPEEQTRVPFIVWLSRGFRADFGVEDQCLAARRSAPLSHDNLFHSVLGLLEVKTRIYDAGLDLFGPCRSPSHTKDGGNCDAGTFLNPAHACSARGSAQHVGLQGLVRRGIPQPDPEQRPVEILARDRTL